MNKEEHKELVIRYIEEVWNQGDTDALEKLTNSTFLYHLSDQMPRDLEMMKSFLESMRTAFPDWRVEIKDISADNSNVTVRWEGKVTNNGVFLGIPPTGKQVKVCGINIYLIENGRISCEWEQMNSPGMLQQMGILQK